ncbi:response regulator [Acidocella sp.]|uniref:response regulator n=1 Tax=Acidocella sp. TaxID=50710 RepID=UPI00262F0698|nr:response regulator [Acidocella sp.]
MATAEFPIEKCVLVVEDEPLIRMLAKEIVEDAGYVAIEAANADEAVSILENRDDIWVVFADIDMPGTLDGMGLANSIRNRWPPIEIIVTSGQMRFQIAELPARTVFIPKPYQFSKVAQTLKDFSRPPH